MFVCALYSFAFYGPSSSTLRPFFPAIFLMFYTLFYTSSCLKDGWLRRVRMRKKIFFSLLLFYRCDFYNLGFRGEAQLGGRGHVVMWRQGRRKVWKSRGVSIIFNWSAKIWGLPWRPWQPQGQPPWEGIICPPPLDGGVGAIASPWFRRSFRMDFFKLS